MSLKNQVGWARKARQLLMSAEGRAELKKFGIDIDFVGKQDEQREKEKPIVAVLCPTYRAPKPQMRDALAKAVQFAAPYATIYAGPPIQASVVHWSRNMLISEQLKSGKPWTHVLFIDDDIVVEPDHIAKLLSHQKDIVAGLCTRRQDPPLPNMLHYNEETGRYDRIWEWEEGSLIGGDKHLAIGTGLMLISKHALEQIAQVHFDCLWEQEVYGLAGEKLDEMKAQRLKAFDNEKRCYWFRFLGPVAEMGEDISFCHLATHFAHIPVYVDTSVQPGHLGEYSFGIKDFLPYREQMILEAKVLGNYPMDVPGMKISVLCPTRGRPENVKRLLQSLAETSTVMPEVVFYVDEDDKSFPGALEYADTQVVRGDRITLSKCYNRCAQAASGEILMLAGDDIVFRTQGWDDIVRRAFAAFEDRLIYVHGDDGIHGPKFGTHGFVHRAWTEAAGYLVPPYFSADYTDTWLNDVFNAVGRRIPLKFSTEHLHPIAGKAEMDQTYQEGRARLKADNMEEVYAKLEPERIRDVEKLKARLGKAWTGVHESFVQGVQVQKNESELVAVG